MSVFIEQLQLIQYTSLKDVEMKHFSENLLNTRCYALGAKYNNTHAKRLTTIGMINILVSNFLRSFIGIL